MKRMVCIILFLLLPATAFAVSDLDVMVYGHNIQAAIFGAQELTGQPVIDNEKGTATFTLSKGLYCIFFIEGEEVTGFACACTDPAQESEFLAQCVTACYNFAGTNAGDTCFDAILSQFMFARGGNELESTAQVPGLMLGISKMKTGYAFIMTRIK